jgi:hypothetical protein
LGGQFEWKYFFLLDGSLLYDEKSAKVLYKPSSQLFLTALTVLYVYRKCMVPPEFSGDQFDGKEGRLPLPPKN